MYDEMMQNNNGLGASMKVAGKAVRRWWWLALPSLVLTVAAALLLTSRTDAVYSSEAEVVIRTEDSANLFPLGDLETLRRSPSAEAGFLASTEFESSAREAAGSDVDVDVDVGELGTRVEPSFISFQARSNDPEIAATTAQAWAETYIALRHVRDVSDLTSTASTLQDQLGELALERDALLGAVSPIDDALQRTDDGTEIARLTTQRLALVASLEPVLEPLDAQISALSTELADLGVVEAFLDDSELSARVNRTAEVPTSPIAPSLPRNLAVAIFLGLALGAGLIIAAEALDDRARGSNDVVERIGLPCLTTVPNTRAGKVDVVPAAGPRAEAFQRLASTINFSTALGSPAQVVMFTSARAAESKSTSVAHLGVTLARRGRRTLIVGADLRRPTLASRFQITRGPGLAEVTSGLYGADAVIQQVEGHPHLSVLRAGIVPNDASPVDLFRSTTFEETIEHLRSEYDHILIDCPPVLPVVDALEIARVADGIVLSVFAGRSRLSLVEKALDMIVQSTATPILGFTLAGVKGGVEGYRYNGYYSSVEETSSIRDVRRSVPQIAATATAVTTQIIEPSNEANVELEPEAIPTVEAEIVAIDRDVISIDEVEFGAPVVSEFDPTNSDTHTISKNRLGGEETKEMVAKQQKKGLRRLVGLVTGFAVLLLSIPVLGAQTSYEGPSTQEGIFEVPSDIADGGSFEFTVEDLEPFSEITIVIEGPSGPVDGLVQVGGAVVVQADANGDFTGEFAIPGDVADGLYTITATGTSADGSAFVSTVSFTTTSNGGVVQENNASQAGTLAFTGSSSRTAALNGVLIVAVGLALVFIAARMRDRAPEAVQ